MNCPSCHAENEPSAWACFACGAPLDPALAGLAAGVVFASRFEILGPLGRGGMGMVYRARDRELHETVAIKILRPDVARQGGRVEQRFRSEIRLARRVRHRNVCSVYGDGEDRGLRYICMELVEGDNLARAAREGGGLGEAAAWDATLQVADGLCAIHEVGVIHRDFKTANLMRDHGGVVRVMDFGIAKQHGSATGAITVTSTGSLMGTPEYMSPEQLRGEDVDFRSDLYSFAIVIYELFTGALPFRGDTPVVTIVKQLQDPPDLESPLLPPAMRPVLGRALAKEPGRRYPSAEQMRRALREARASAAGGVIGGAGIPGDVDFVFDDTRPVGAQGPPAREAVPILRIALGLAATAALAAHLLSAGGVRPGGVPPMVVAETPAPAPTPSPTFTPAVPRVPRPRRAPASLPAAPAVRPPAPPEPTPLATPTPEATPAPPAPPTTPPTGATRVYNEDEVDLAPRRVSGTTRPYPEWGPRLEKGKRTSITASFTVTEAGDVTDIRVDKGEEALEGLLLEISRWKFKPGRKGGVPVKVRVRWTQTFIGG